MSGWGLHKRGRNEPSCRSAAIQGISLVTAKGAYGIVTKELFVLTAVACRLCVAGYRLAFNIRIPQRGLHAAGQVVGARAGRDGAGQAPSVRLCLSAGETQMAFQRRSSQSDGCSRCREGRVGRALGRQRRGRHACDAFQRHHFLDVRQVEGWVGLCCDEEGGQAARW